MKVSLNKANKLRNALEGLVIEIPLTGTIRSDVSVETINTAFNSAVKLSTDKIGESLEKINFLFKLRIIISETNSKNEISTLMNEIACHEKGLSFLGGVLNNRYAGGSSLSDILAAVRYQDELKSADPKLAQAPKNFTASLMTDALKAKLIETVNTLRLELEELKEKRNELNHSVHIELPKDLVEFLRKHSLVK